MTDKSSLESRTRIAGHFQEIMIEMGLDMNDPSLEETPMRVAKFMLEYSQPFDPAEVMKTFEHKEKSHGMPMVIQRNVPFAGLCEHHFAPFHGTADIGYIANGKVLGLSKMKRLVDGICHRRPSIQERLTNEIADSINDGLEAKGVMVVVTAVHTCMVCRGIETHGIDTITSACRGNYLLIPAARMEFLELRRKL